MRVWQYYDHKCRHARKPLRAIARIKVSTTATILSASPRVIAPLASAEVTAFIGRTIVGLQPTGFVPWECSRSVATGMTAGAVAQPALVERLPRTRPGGFGLSPSVAASPLV
jgi:hypothetical protein